MAGVSGNIATLAVGKQSAKDTPQTTPTYKLKFTGGNVEARRDTIQLAETDSSRQQGATVVTGTRVEGSSEHYVRPSSFGLLGYLALGAISTTGVGPYVHTITPSASALPYATLYKAIGSTILVDRYSDCWISSLVLRGSAGGALTCSVNWMGLKALHGETDPVLAVETATPLVYPDVTVTLGGSTTAIVESFEVTFDNQSQLIPGDTGIYHADHALGELQARGTMTLLFENDQEYRRHLTGTVGGTAPTTTVASQALTIAANAGASAIVEAIFAGVAWTEFPVNPDPGGAPIKVAAGFYSLPQAAIGDYAKLRVTNSVASY